MQEWFRLPLEILQKDWLDKPEALALFLHILRKAEMEECKRNGLNLRRGQYVTSLSILSKSSRQGKQVVRTCLTKLKKLNLIQTESNFRNTIISVINYDEYFAIQKQAVQCGGNNEMENERQKPKPKKTKEEVIADTEKRKEKFYQELVPYVETYGRSMIRQFFDYWSEPNKSGSRMRFEQEKTWDLNRRLCRWFNNNKQYERDRNESRKPNADERIQSAANLVNQLLSEQ